MPENDLVKKAELLQFEARQAMRKVPPHVLLMGGPAVKAAMALLDQTAGLMVEMAETIERG